jgi:hypothetical protein
MVSIVIPNVANLGYGYKLGKKDINDFDLQTICKFQQTFVIDFYQFSKLLL